MSPRAALSAGLLAVALGALLAATPHVRAAGPERMDLTIYVKGDLIARGGVIVVNPVPVPPEQWRAAVTATAPGLPPPADLGSPPAGEARLTLAVESRYANVQFLFPEGTRYTYRLRPHPDARAPAPPGVQILEVAGDHELSVGFAGQQTSGDRTIRIPGPDTDERDARVLAVIARDRSALQPRIACAAQPAIQLCTFPQADWPAITERWRKQRLALDREYRRMERLDECQQAAERDGRRRSACELVSGENEEPRYEYRP
ncbi:hypothetical protein [Phreatobacter sp. AB_2022a]|uniref:hypothetical protein n=1 Tax=Phreatobacter sp. AB_2022a TaxID=3003134 RepID=UPI002286D006|nr:hypothetical protein [Phreatobacter sp. AB_2022a]MCZ0735335.1 hypothetical protein [Phreatobacter sp. AB_2022a]